MTRRIKRFSPLQLGKVLGILYALCALIFVPLFMIFGLASTLMPQPQGGPPPALFAGGALLFALLMPLLYGAMGFISGVIGAFVYNLVARWIGGIEVEVE